MRAAFIGKTLDGHYGNGVTWTETYLADGRLDYRESARQAVGNWHFRGHVFCTFYDPPLLQPAADGGCWTAIKTSANCYEFYLAGLAPISRSRTTRAAGAGAGMRAAGARTSPRPARRSRASDAGEPIFPLRACGRRALRPADGRACHAGVDERRGDTRGDDRQTVSKVSFAPAPSGR